MDKTQLKILLSRLAPVDDKTPALEQYQTSPAIAAELLAQADLAGDLDGTVADLGCGNGILALGAAVLGAETVHGYDVDETAVTVAEENRATLEDELGRDLPVTFTAADIQDIEQSADTIAMNPPFGLKQGNEQANKRFLENAFAMAPTVYALLHQSDAKRADTRDHLRSFASGHGYDTDILAWFRFPLPRAYAFHEKEQAETKVDLYRFTRS